MKTSAVAAVLVLAAAVLPAGVLAAEEKAPAPKSTPGMAPQGVKMSGTATVTATVQAIDLEKRLVTVRGPKGNEVTLEAGDEVRNLPQVKVGDQVVVRYYESIAFEMKKEAGEPVAAAAAGVGRAEPGEKPAAGGARMIVADVTVQSIDMKTMMVTVKGPRGNLFEVKAQDPKRLEALKVGDQIRVTYTQALAVSVEPAAK